MRDRHPQRPHARPCRHPPGSIGSPPAPRRSVSEAAAARRRAADWKRTFFFLWLSQLTAIASFPSALRFLPLYVQTLGITDPGEAAIWAGAASSGGGLSMAVMATVWGALAD